MILVEKVRKYHGKNVVDAFIQSADILTDRTLVHFRENGVYKTKSWKEMRDDVNNLSSYFVSKGIKKGDRIAIFSYNCKEWWIADLAILSIGAVSVPVYPTNSANETSYVVNHSGSTVCMVGNEEQLEKVLSDKKEFAGLKSIITFFDTTSKRKIVSLKQALSLGKKASKYSEVNKRVKAIKDKDLATIVYTSGTTGNPKGVMLSHGNLFSDVAQISERFGNYVTEDDVFLSFLPLSHVLERTTGFFTPIYLNCSVAFAEHFRTISRDLQEVQPTVIISVPRLFEKIHSGVMATVNSMPLIKRVVVKWALRMGKKNIPNLCRNKLPSGLFGVFYRFADRNVLSVLRKEIGFLRNKIAISGGGPLSYSDLEFFLSMGINLFEGYGLTETSPVVNVNLPCKLKPGTVGPAMPSTQTSLSDEGEILVKGPQVMAGYYRDKAATKSAFNEEGWLKTGDIGFVDEDGCLTINGRIKDIIVTAGGKNISPQNIENAILGSQYIENIAVIGDRRKYLSALIIPCFPELEKWAKKRGVVYADKNDMVRNEDVIKLYFSEIETVMKDFARVEQIKRFTVINDIWGIESGELTPTLKVKRRVIEKKYAEIIDAMYRD